MVAAEAETVAAKASETEAVVWRRQKQRECLYGGYVGGSQWNQRRSGDGRKKAVAAVAEAEGIQPMVSAAPKVAVVSADNSGNGGAAVGGRNRGSVGATTINQNVAAVGDGDTGTGVGGIGGGGSCSSGSGGRGSYNDRGRL